MTTLRDAAQAVANTWDATDLEDPVCITFLTADIEDLKEALSSPPRATELLRELVAAIDAADRNGLPAAEANAQSALRSAREFLEAQPENNERATK